MPRKNPGQEVLNSYKVYFVNGKSISVHSPEKLIAELGKPDKGGFHLDDEVFLNINNVNYIVNTTKPLEEQK